MLLLLGKAGPVSAEDQRLKLSAPAEFQRQVVAHLAVVLAGKFETDDLERTLHGAEVRDDDLIVLHRAVEEALAHQFVGALVLEQAAAG